MYPTAFLLFGILAVCLVLEVPIAFALGAAGAATIMILGLAPLATVPQLLFGAADSFSLLAIPLFIFAGLLMERTGISRRLIALADAVVGNLRGGLGLVTVSVAIFFAGISGSGPADVAALGLFLVPAMIETGYRDGFAAALVAASGGIGIIVPPSIALIIYGVVAEVSISRLFIAGIVPGIIVGLALMAAVRWEVRRSPRRSTTRRRNLGRAFREALPGIVAPVIILGGIYGGVFTATEAAAVAVVYAVLIGRFVYRDLTWRGLFDAARKGAATSGAIMAIVICAALFAWPLTAEGIGPAIGGWLGGVAGTPWLLLLAVNAVLLVAGCVLDAISVYYVIVPVLLHAIRTVNATAAHPIDLVQFGVVVAVNLAIGQITPPVGVNLFAAASVSDVPVRTIARSVWPLFLAETAALLLITYVPALSLWLPSLMH